MIKSKMEAIRDSYTNNAIPNDYIIISINCPLENPTHFYNNPKIKDVLRLYFDDIEYRTEHGIPMNESDGIKVAKFINQWKDKVDTIVVHCHAGVSRSAGVGASISRYLNSVKDELEIWNNHKYAPNGLCYRLTCKAFDIEITDEELKKLKDINNDAYDRYYTDESNEDMKVINKMLGKE